MKKILALTFLLSTSAFANSMITVDTMYVEGRAEIWVSNNTDVNLNCDYVVNWRTSLLDLHRNWGNRYVPASEKVRIVVADSRGLPVVKATPKFDCSETN